MNQGADERREFQRLRLDEPVTGTFEETPVSVLEIGVLGARIGHDAPLDAGRGELRFPSAGGEIAMRCDIVRSSQAGEQFTSGVRFVAAIGESGDELRAMLGRLVVKALGDRSGAATGTLKIRHIDGDKTIRAKDAQFVSYRLEHGGWKRRHVFLPEQPVSGFTVARGEDTEEMQRLCRVYEVSDDEGRRLIRLFAELSVSDLLQIPPQS